jgi:hypothetical protein
MVFVISPVVYFKGHQKDVHIILEWLTLNAREYTLSTSGVVGQSHLPYSIPTLVTPLTYGGCYRYDTLERVFRLA